MNIIFINPKTGSTKSIPLRNSFIISFGIALVVVSGAFGVVLERSLSNGINHELLSRAALKVDIEQSKKDIDDAKQAAQDQLTALTVRLAEVQSRVVRLDALGERLVGIAKLEGGEFDFSSSPAVGGPITGSTDEAYQKPSIIDVMEQLSVDIDHRKRQLDIIENLLANRELKNSVYLAGRPVKWGWLSSPFGRRNDPFTGRLAWHKGVDFAGKDGSDIISVGSGVVTWAGERYGYGLLVEVNHGDGFTTRYGHAKEVLVSVGDIVGKGQTVALMGSTGRSTGPHVHFEVRKHGKALDPKRYVNRREKG